MISSSMGAVMAVILIVNTHPERQSAIGSHIGLQVIAEPICRVSFCYLVQQFYIVSFCYHACETILYEYVSLC